MNDVRHEREVTAPRQPPTRTVAAPAPAPASAPAPAPAPAPARWGARKWFDHAEPHLARGPFMRWPVAADSALAVVVVAISVVAVAVSALDDGEEFTVASLTDRPVGALALLALAGLALVWRRRQTVLVTGFVLTIVLIWAIAGYGDGQDLAVVVAVYSIGRYTPSQRTSLIVVAASAAIEVLGTFVDSHQRIDIAPAVLLTVLPWYVGRRIRNRGDYVVLLQERADSVEAEQQARAREAVMQERSRLARELHDVVAHQVSMMTVQAGAAKTVARDDLDAAIEAMGDVERAGRQALGELRHLLGVLRPETPDAADLGPQPGLTDISSLADELRHTGAEVTQSIVELPTENPMTDRVGLSAYRIVQESCTNIIKHAGPHPVVHLDVDMTGDALVIDIVNTIDTAIVGSTSRARLAADSGVLGRPELPTSGYGIAGMRERASLLGGTLTAGSDTVGQFRVHARLPVTTRSA